MRAKRTDPVFLGPIKWALGTAGVARGIYVGVVTTQAFISRRGHAYRYQFRVEIERNKIFGMWQINVYRERLGDMPKTPDDARWDAISLNQPHPLSSRSLPAAKARARQYINNCLLPEL